MMKEIIKISTTIRLNINTLSVQVLTLTSSVPGLEMNGNAYVQDY